MLDWISRLGPSRTLSLLVSIAYLLISFFIGQPKSAREVLLVLLVVMAAVVFPLACIWFADEIGEYVGALPGPGITKKSPAWMVKIGGWCLLLLPLIFGLIIARA
jgi:uncharacterized membrane protein YoaT (DUF817 family)